MNLKIFFPKASKPNISLLCGITMGLSEAEVFPTKLEERLWSLKATELHPICTN